jgi:hypothetical protein
MTPEQRDRLDLIRARSNSGVLQAEDVLHDARDPASPLHECFTWDDSEAAEAYRLLQAKNVIRIAVRFLPVPDVRVQRVNVTLRDYVRNDPQPEATDAISELFSMNAREAEITVQIYALMQEKEHLRSILMASPSGFENELYALDLFMRGVPMGDLIEVINQAGDGEIYREADVLGWIKKYGGHRPRHWSARLAKEQWDVDEGQNFGAVFGVPPYQPPTKVTVRSSTREIQHAAGHH